MKLRSLRWALVLLLLIVPVPALSGLPGPCFQGNTTPDCSPTETHTYPNGVAAYFFTAGRATVSQNTVARIVVIPGRTTASGAQWPTLELRQSMTAGKLDFYANGLFQMQLDPDVNSSITAAIGVVGHFQPTYVMPTRPFQDIWDALQTGASQACNEATAYVALLTAALVATTVSDPSPGNIAAVALIAKELRDALAAQRQACNV